MAIASLNDSESRSIYRDRLTEVVITTEKEVQKVSSNENEIIPFSLTEPAPLHYFELPMEFQYEPKEILPLTVVLPSSSTVACNGDSLTGMVREAFELESRLQGDNHETN